MGNISKNLDQAMSKKKVAEEEGGGKHKEKTHTVLWAQLGQILHLGVHITSCTVTLPINEY